MADAMLGIPKSLPGEDEPERSSDDETSSYDSDVHFEVVISSTNIYHPPLYDEERIRILTILPGGAYNQLRCLLTVVSLASDEPYEALSYTWGSAESPRSILIGIEGQVLEVRRNLYDALLHLRQPNGTRRMWIDAICINQDNRRERSRQVRMMKRIYSNAMRVIVWLGMPLSNAGWEAHQLNNLKDPSEVSRSVGWIDAARLDITSRSYWNRIWIVPEIVNATKISVLMGREYISWRSIWALLWSFPANSAAGKLSAVSAEETERRDNGLQQIQMLMRHRQQQRRHGQIRLEEALFRYQHCESTDFRDKVIALLGLSQPTRLHIEYVNDRMSREALFLETIEVCHAESPGTIAGALSRMLQLELRIFEPPRHPSLLHGSGCEVRSSLVIDPPTALFDVVPGFIHEGRSLKPGYRKEFDMGSFMTSLREWFDEAFWESQATYGVSRLHDLDKEKHANICAAWAKIKTKAFFCNADDDDEDFRGHPIHHHFILIMPVEYAVDEPKRAIVLISPFSKLLRLRVKASKAWSWATLSV